MVLLSVLAILFVSTLIRATLGFGNALLAMPLLALTVGLHTATPLVALASMTIAVLMLWGNWRSIDVRSAWRLILASLFGIPLGLLLLTSVPEHLVKALLGLLLVAFGLYNLFEFRLPTLSGRGSAYLFGFGAGVLGGAYNTNGPPVIIYGMLTGWTPEQFRATLQGYFFTSGILILFGHALAGLWTAAVLRLYLLSLPVVVLAVLLGNLLNRYIPPGRFNRIVYGVLIGMGILLIV
jgi:hypothetical protein